MYAAKTDPKTRKRAPSKRSIETGQKVLNAAEKLFANRGFDGTSIRDIAAEAGVTPALVTFHGGPKDQLLETVVERRAEELSALRLARLEAVEAVNQPPRIRPILSAFIEPLLEKAASGDAQWLSYARLIAMVSAEERWAALTARCFDPTAQRFARAMAVCLPDAPPRKVAAGFVFTVSAMLSLCTAQWRVEALAGEQTAQRPLLDPALLEGLIDYCTAGMLALAQQP